MQWIMPVDIEDILRQDLDAIYHAAEITGIRFVAPPLPPELGEIPQETIAEIRRVGGDRTDLVIDRHSISIDVYAETWQTATYEANRLAAIIEALPYQNETQVRYERTEITTLPYALPDTSNPIHPRMRMLVLITVKAAIDAAS